MNFRLKLAIAIPVLAIIIAVIALVVMWSLARYQQAKFEDLSTRVSALRAGESTLADAEALYRFYKSRATIDEWKCDGESCKLRIELANFLVNCFPDKIMVEDTLRINTHFLRRLGIRPAIAISEVFVSNGKVKQVDFSTTYESPIGFWVWGAWHAMDEFDHALKCQSLKLQRNSNYVVQSFPNGSDSFHGRVVTAFFQTQASPDEKNRSQYIKFGCMTSPFDCTKNLSLGAGPFMPLVYQDILAEKAIRDAKPQEYSTAYKAYEDCVYEPGLR
jgi:nitrogen fixation-related uncharacterized protein